MFNIYYTNKFAKDLKAVQKRGKNIEKLKLVMNLLVEGVKLPVQLRDHQLIGNFKGRRECHIEPYWLLIYKISANKKEIVFERTGSHSDLFSC